MILFRLIGSNWQRSDTKSTRPWFRLRQEQRQRQRRRQGLEGEPRGPQDLEEHHQVQGRTIFEFHFEKCSFKSWFLSCMPEAPLEFQFWFEFCVLNNDLFNNISFVLINLNDLFNSYKLEHGFHSKLKWNMRNEPCSFTFNNEHLVLS